jgi:hypothetical protein
MPRRLTDEQRDEKRRMRLAIRRFRDRFGVHPSDVDDLAGVATCTTSYATSYPKAVSYARMRRVVDEIERAGWERRPHPDRRPCQNQKIERGYKRLLCAIFGDPE